MKKSALYFFSVTMFVVMLQLLLTGCTTPALDTLLAKDTPVTNESLKPKDALFLPELLEADGRTWLEIDPTQGWNNPWREWMWGDWIWRYYDDWTQTYHDYWIGTLGYPDCPNRCEQLNNLLEQECVIECLIKYYYLEQQVTIYEVKTSTYKEKFGHEIAICEAEDCPAGYTLYVQVADADITTMYELGYRSIVTSCDTVPPDTYIYGCSP
jgi:hypothetical protein